MSSSHTHKRNVSERPERPKRPIVSNDAPFALDVLGTLPDIPQMERPKDRATPKAARRARLTVDTVSGLKPEARQYYVWDLKRTGFGVRVNASGGVAYVVKLNLPGKRSVWKTLKAKHLALAEVEYYELLVKFGRGESLRGKPRESLWQDAVDKFETEHLQTVKPSTAVSYRSSLKHIRAAFKDRPIRSLTYQDVWSFHKDMAATPRTANVCVRLSGQIFDRAEVWGMRDLNTNPVDLLHKAGWKPYTEDERQRPLEEEELERIGGALAAMEEGGEESPFQIASVRLLFFLGRRLREVLGIEWEQLDLKARSIHWKNTKTGPATAPLNDAAWEVISQLPRMTYKNAEGEVVDHPYVLPGKKPGRPMYDIRKFWTRMLDLAKVENLWRHDLRHAHGNEAAGLGLNPQTTAALLGHKNMASSNRYSKTGLDPRLEASQKVAGSLSNKLQGKK